jgi:predicted ferric reductase
LPRFLARFLPVSIAFTTVGDLVLLAPLLIFVLRGIHYTFVAPSLNLSGSMAAYCVYFTYVTASKSNSPFSFFLGIPYERLIGLHFMSAVCAGVLGGFHGYVAYNYGGDDDGDSKYSKAAALGDPKLEPNTWKFLWDGESNVTGTVLLGSMIAMVLLSSFSILRRYLFNIWYYLHILLGVAVLVTLFLHSVLSAVFVTLWWALDATIRYGILAGHTTMAELRMVGPPMPKRNDHKSWEPAVELKIAKPPGFQYNAGQFFRIAVPAINPVEFHPISVSSAPHEEMMTLHIRRLGDWTTKLCRFAMENEKTPVRIEGPYGALSVDLEDDFKYKLVLFVSGGIGVTPCQSIGKELLWAHRHQGRNLKELRFVWAVREMQMVRDIPPLLLEQEPTDNYSTSSPEFQRMTDRSQSFRMGQPFRNPVDDSGASRSFRARTVDDSGTSKSLRGPTARSSKNELQGRGMSKGLSVISRGLAKGLSKVGLVKRRRPAVVQADIYLTKSDVDTEASQGLPYNIHQGRPDLDQIFVDMKSNATSLGETNIAVIGCGPPSLMASLQEACRKHSASVVGCQTGVVFFDLHKEHFEL